MQRFIVGLGFALLASSALPSYAQNNKPVRTGIYYEDRAANSNAGSNVNLTFAQAPTDKFFNITDVDCFIQSSLNYPLAYAILSIGTQSGFNDLGREFYVAGNAYRGDGSTSSYSTITNKVNIKVGPGRYPTIALSVKPGTSTINGSCAIVGNLSDS